MNLNTVTRPTAVYLKSRGIVSQEQLDLLLNPLNLTQTIAAHGLLPGLQQVTEAVVTVITKGGSILVHGDYDADGITATVVLTTFLRGCGAKVIPFVPNRKTGYDISSETIEYAKENNVDLIITVDCGITAVEVVELAKQNNLKIIITDHHQPGTTLPDTLIINPNLDPTSAYAGLAGVGVAYLVGRYIYQSCMTESSTAVTVMDRRLLPVVTLGTVADVVPLIGLNRVIVKYGLQLLQDSNYPNLSSGMVELISKLKLGPSITAQDIAFKIAPRINAVGRIADPTLAMEFLLTDDKRQAETLGEKIAEIVTLRKVITERMLKQAEQLVVKDAAAQVLFDFTWHPGVAGIIAANITEKTKTPSIVLTPTHGEPGRYSGSARGVKGVDLLAVLNSVNAELPLIKCGGHALAAGVTIASEQLDQFRQLFVATVARMRDTSEASCDYDGIVTLKELEPAFFEELLQLEPFGSGWPTPVFCLERVSAINISPIGTKFVRGKLADKFSWLAFISFRYSIDDLPTQPWKVICRPMYQPNSDYRDKMKLEIIDLEHAGNKELP